MLKERLPKQAFCESKREKASGTTTKALVRLDWRSKMESFGASIKRNVGSGDGLWCMLTQSRFFIPVTFTYMSGFWKKKTFNRPTNGLFFRDLISLMCLFKGDF